MSPSSFGGLLSVAGVPSLIDASLQSLSLHSSGGLCTSQNFLCCIFIRTGDIELRADPKSRVISEDTEL